MQKFALSAGADFAVPANHWAQGGLGAVQLAEAVIEACRDESTFRFLYDLNIPLTEKMTIIAKEMYGADGISLSAEAQAEVDRYERQGYGRLPICTAKTACRFQTIRKEGCAHGFHAAEPQCHAVGWGELCLSAGREYEHDARIVNAAGVLRYRSESGDG